MSKRLMNEMQRATVADDSGCHISWPDESDLHKAHGVISGPDGSPYEGGIFNVHITFPVSYPMAPPKVILATRIYHPNINGNNGKICIDILDDNWSPALNIKQVLLSIRSLLNEPNFGHPLVKIPHATDNDKEEYKQIAMEWTKKICICIEEILA